MSSFFGYSWTTSSPVNTENSLVVGSRAGPEDREHLESFESSVEVSAEDLPGKHELAIATAPSAVPRQDSLPKESRTDELIAEGEVDDKPDSEEATEECTTEMSSGLPAKLEAETELAHAEKRTAEVREKTLSTSKVTTTLKEFNTSDDPVGKHDVLQKTTEDTSLVDGEHGSMPASSEPSELLEAEIDLDFVEQYDNAFNEFIVQNTDFLSNNPDLVHNLRITKLQALLQYADEKETEWLQRLEAAKQNKTEMEASYHQKLRDASREKAARDIHLRSMLVALNKETKVMEGKLTWKLIANSEACAKNQQKLIEEFQDKPKTTDRQELLNLLPEGPSFHGIRDAAGAPPLSNSEQSGPLTQEQAGEMRQCQIDNAFLNGEIAMLQKKLEYQRAAATKLGWVESVLVRMEKKSMKKLKSRYKKKINGRLA